jgi:catechol-2,3-dioxygenase
MITPMKLLIALILLALLISVPTRADDVKRPRVLGLAHVALFVSDLQKARAFYEDFLATRNHMY